MQAVHLPNFIFHQAIYLELIIAVRTKQIFVTQIIVDDPIDFRDGNSRQSVIDYIREDSTRWYRIGQTANGEFNNLETMH